MRRRSRSTEFKMMETSGGGGDGGREIRRRPPPATAFLLLWLLLCAALSAAPRAAAVWFRLPRAGTKCVSEEIQSKVIVFGDYAVFNDEESNPITATITAKVTSPSSNVLHYQENVTSGQFGFTTSELGTYLACFWLDGARGGASVASISLDWKIGIAAKDWDSIARRENIEGVELELRKLEAAVEEIHDNLLYLKKREAEMRDVSEMTNFRVAWYGILSLGICILASVLQLWHLKAFFVKKKLI